MKQGSIPTVCLSTVLLKQENVPSSLSYPASRGQVCAGGREAFSVDEQNPRPQEAVLMHRGSNSGTGQLHAGISLRFAIKTGKAQKKSPNVKPTAGCKS